MQKITDPEREMAIPAPLRLAFRPLFLLASVFLIFATIYWLMLMSYQVSWYSPLPIYSWHSHEMIFGFIVPVILGFLLTAVQTWTQIPGINGWKLALLISLWAVGRFSWLHPASPMVLLWLADTLFIACSALVLAKPILYRKQWHNLIFVPILLAFIAVHSLMVWNLQQQTGLANQYARTGLWLVVLMVSLVGGRVIPFFTAKKLNIEQVKESRGMTACIIISIAILLLSSLNAQLPPSIYLAGLTVFMLLQLWRNFRWYHKGIWSEPLLWSLHLCYSFIGLGAALMLYQNISGHTDQNGLHLIALGGLAGLILAITSRVSLGHTGRELKAPNLMPLCFSLCLIAALLRALIPIFWPAQTLLGWVMAGLCLIAAFTGFVICYGPMLLKPRIDNRPG